MKDITGYNGLYAITSCGKVWSYKRKKFLKPMLQKTGYVTVSLCKDGKATLFYLHRLVAEAYIPNPEGLPQVNHKDEDKTHNYSSNLEWCTAGYNMTYGTARVRAARTQGKPVYCVELDKTFDGLAQASRALGLSRNALQCSLKRGYKTCGGYHWKYV